MVEVSIVSERGHELVVEVGPDLQPVRVFRVLRDGELRLLPHRRLTEYELEQLEQALR